MTSLQEGYSAISLSDLRPNEMLPFDIYLYMERNEKLILYRKKNQEFEEDRLKYFEKMKVKNFFIREEDCDTYHKYTSEEFTNILDNDDLSEKEKQVKIKKVTKRFLDDLFTRDLDEKEQLETNVQAVVKNIVTTVSKDIKMGEIYNKLANLISNEETTFSHSLNVSTYSVIFSFALGVVRNQDISNIGIAGVLHDIYLASMPKELIDKYRKGDELNTAEMLNIRKHPNGAEEIIRKRYPQFNEQILWVIRQHHEQPDGLGYPLGIKGENISYLAKILSISNILDNTVRTKRAQGLNPSPAEVFDLMKQRWKHENQIYDKDVFDELVKEIFNWSSL